MSVSAFGVDHGEVSKADKYNGHGAPSGGRRLTAGAFSGWHGAVAGKKGKKLRAAGNEVGGSLVGGYGGGIVGSALGAGVGTLARNPMAGLRAGSALGSLGGGITGTQLGLNRSQRKGYLKKES